MIGAADKVTEQVRRRPRQPALRQEERRGQHDGEPKSERSQPDATAGDRQTEQQVEQHLVLKCPGDAEQWRLVLWQQRHGEQQRPRRNLAERQPDGGGQVHGCQREQYREAEPVGGIDPRQPFPAIGGQCGRAADIAVMHRAGDEAAEHKEEINPGMAGAEDVV